MTGLIERVYTFGYGHYDDKRTDLPLADKCVIVRAATPERCRELMFEHYNNKWAYEYPSIEAAAPDSLPDWRPALFGAIDENGFTPLLQVGYQQDGVDGTAVWCPLGKEAACRHWQEHKLFRPALTHIWEHRPDGRGIASMQRRCARCDRWETDDNRDGECVKPIVRVIR